MCLVVYGGVGLPGDENSWRALFTARCVPRLPIFLPLPLPLNGSPGV